MKAKDLLGKEVIDVDAKVVGKVVDIDLDIGEATILDISVKTGFTKKMSISPRDIDKIGDKVLLRVAKDKMKKA
ncbi:MAG: PRC-barrel domain-containing protein [Chloroflexi bacterium]|nr:PRC-barrel domain-containing protein [Chloroflexota bacterium]MBL7061608.1 PRC-barrel domain-containing protein [Dehalococcoidia bacterium]